MKRMWQIYDEGEYSFVTKKQFKEIFGDDPDPKVAFIENTDAQPDEPKWVPEFPDEYQAYLDSFFD